MKKIFFIIAMAIVMALALVSCSRSDDPVQKREAAATKLLRRKHLIKIAVAGPWAQNRNLMLEGLDLACEQLNAEGGVLGAKIELVKVDDNGNLEGGGKAAYQIASDNQICAVIGHPFSAISLSNSLIYHYYGLLMFSPTSTGTNLTQQGLPYVFRNIPDNDAIGIEAAQFCERLNWNRVMIYYLNNSYGEGLANAFELQCGTNSVSVLDRASYENIYSLYDYSEVVKNWKSNYVFDAVFIAGSMPQIAEIVSVFRDNGITQPIIGGDTFDISTFFAFGDNSSEENVYCVSNFNIDAKNQKFMDFREAFIKKYGHDVDQHALQGYDALKVLVNAIGMAGSVKAKDIAQALRNARIWDEGAGPYAFDENGNIKQRILTVKKAGNGEFKAVN
ncbi:MAG: ABC transporter substrate-binding protein [Treponema sp.]|nr:ABC transporter substrate-binding protein [Treponema sp.]